MKKNIKMTLFQMLHEEKTVLSIEFNVLTWQTLSWKTVQNTDDLITMWARQIERCNTNIEKIKTHLQHMQIQDKK